MDIRTASFLIISIVAMVCGTVLAITGQSEAAFTMLGLAGTCAGYIVGLHSEPYDAVAMPDDEAEGGAV